MLPGVGESQPERQHDREQGEVGEGGPAAVRGHAHVQGLGLNLLELGVAPGLL